MIRAVNNAETETGAAEHAALPFRLDHLSASAIKDYLGCSLRYYFGRVLGLEQPVGPALQLGKAVHAAIQRYYLALWRGQDASPEYVESAYYEAFDRLEETEGPVFYDKGGRDAVRVKGLEIVRAYLASSHPVAREAIAGVEVRLADHFEGIPLEMVGYVDLVYRDPGGNLVAVDFKTVATQPNLDHEVFLHETQTVLYQMLIEAASGKCPGARELVFLTKHKEPRVIVHRIGPAESTAIERLKAMARAAADGIHAGRWVPQPGMACSWCAFRSECERWTGDVP